MNAMTDRLPDGAPLRVLHVLDHSIPLHSGYTFRTLSILREQRKLGWETFQLTSPKQGPARADEETVDGWHFFRTSFDFDRGPKLPGVGELRQMAAMRKRIAEALSIDNGRVNVKAKTNEGLDAIGRGEAIAAIAVALITDATA